MVLPWVLTALLRAGIGAPLQEASADDLLLFQRALDRPGEVRREQLERIASRQSAPARETLQRLYPLLPDPDRRADLLASLSRFRETSEEAATLEFLEALLAGTRNPEESRNTGLALAAFGPAALPVARRITGQSKRYHAFLSALELLVDGADREDLPLLTRFARGELLSHLLRLGLPGHDDWLAFASDLRCRALVRCSHEEGGRALLESQLESTDPRIQACALRALASERSSAALARAHTILQVPPPGYSESELEELISASCSVLGGDARSSSVQRLLQTAATSVRWHNMARDALRGMPDELLQAELLPRLQTSARSEEAWMFLDLLGGADSPEVTDALIKLLGHADDLIQAQAARLLGERREPGALIALRRLSRREGEEVRAAAVFALTRLQPADVAWRDSLRELLEHRSVLLRLAAVESLAYLVDPAALPGLHAMLVDRDWRVRLAVVRALERIRDRRSVPLLVARLPVERRRIQEAIARTLRFHTGMPFRTSAHDWRRFLEAEGETFALPSRHAAEELEDRLERGTTFAGTEARFYGLRVHSDHLTLVIDVSGSMNDPAAFSPTGSRSSEFGQTKLEVAQQEVAHLLAQLAETESLNLLFFAERTRAWKPQLTPLSLETSAAAEAFVMGQHAAGGTNLFGALERALADPEVDTLYLLSDGLPTVGPVQDPAAIREETRRRNPGGQVTIHCIAIGHESILLRWLAEDTGGEYVRR